MKTKAFDRKLYAEALRQLAPMGLTFLILAAVTTILHVTGQGDIPGPAEFYPQYIEPASLAFGAHLALVAAIFLCLTAFQFTTQRNASDVYYAMPQGRLCLFTSFYGAVITWLLAIVFGAALLGGFTASLFPDVFGFFWGELLEYAGTLFAIALYIAAFFALAAAFSGSTIGTLCLAIALLFIPRLVVYMLSQMVALVGVLVLDSLAWPFNRINLFTKLFYNVLDNYGSYGIYSQSYGLTEVFSAGAGTNRLALLYTLGAALFWSVAAALCFRRRTSEAAEHATSSSRVRAALRIGLAFIPCLIPIEALNELRLCGGTSHSASSIGSALVVALLIFFATEFLLTRNLQSLKKTMPSLGILLLVCALAFGGVLLGDKIARSYLPQPENLSYVRLIEGYGERSELNDRLREVKLTDPEIKAILCRSLQRRTDAFDFDYEYEYGHDADVLQVAFRSGLWERVRCVNITYDDIRALGMALRSDEEVRKSCLLPPEEEALHSVVFYTIEGSVPILSEEDSLLIYRSLREEMQEVDFEVLYREYFFPRASRHVADPESDSEAEANRSISAGHLSIAVIGDDPLGYVTSLTVSANYPKTYALCLSLCEAAGVANRAEMLDALAHLASTPDAQAGATLGIRVKTEDGTVFTHTDMRYGDPQQFGVYISSGPSLQLEREDLLLLQRLLTSEEMLRMPEEGTRAVVQLHLYDYSQGDGLPEGVHAGFHAFALPQEFIEWLKGLEK